MTIDEERLRAINATREYLYEKINGRTKLRNRKERAKVFRLLRHYPQTHWVDDIGSIILEKDGKTDYKLRRDVHGDPVAITLDGVDVIHLVPSERTNFMIDGFMKQINWRTEKTKKR